MLVVAGLIDRVDPDMTRCHVGSSYSSNHSHTDNGCQHGVGLIRIFRPLDKDVHTTAFTERPMADELQVMQSSIKLP